MSTSKRPLIGLALGSGSARGWAHIGVIRALESHGIKPDIVCGCSVGSLVGAAYASSHLDRLERWVRELNFWDVVKLLDVKLAGGLIEGTSLMTFFEEQVADVDIADLDLPFAAVATDLANGREVWLQEGRLQDAVRASIALPGLFAPCRQNGQWLIDGGLVNPVPVSLCRALGAEIIIAVNLNSDIVGRHRNDRAKPELSHMAGGRDLLGQLLERLNEGLRDKGLPTYHRKVQQNEAELPGLLEVTATAINIMQDRITRSRMAGDPPDVILTPRLAHLGLLEFDRGEEAIAEGETCVERMIPLIEQLFSR